MEKQKVKENNRVVLLVGIKYEYNMFLCPPIFLLNINAWE